MCEYNKIKHLASNEVKSAVNWWAKTIEDSKKFLKILFMGKSTTIGIHPNHQGDQLIVQF